jgi:hypothetical protein
MSSDGEEDIVATEKFFSEPRENSQIKATIIAKYFFAWAKIVGQHSDKIAYIDLFAGPGRYEDDTVLVQRERDFCWA